MKIIYTHLVIDKYMEMFGWMLELHPLLPLSYIQDLKDQHNHPSAVCTQLSRSKK